MDALILAGGENSRFLSHKALAEVNGRRIIDKTVEQFKFYFKNIYISTNTPEIFYYLGLPLIGDLSSEKGPMTGIYSAFVAAGAKELFVAACDMPFIQDGLLELLLSNYDGKRALIPVFEGRPQPLFGIYPWSIVDIMKSHLLMGTKAMWDLLDSISPSLLPEEIVRKADPEGRTFININTLDQYQSLIANGC